MSKTPEPSVLDENTISYVKNLIEANPRVEKLQGVIGNFKDLYDFAQRLDASVLSKKNLEFLAYSGTFDAIENNRNKVYQSINILSLLKLYLTKINDLFGSGR